MTKHEKKIFNIEEYIRNNQNFRIALLGLCGSGKTFFARKLCTNFLHLKKRNIICCDTKHEFTDMKVFEPFMDLKEKGILRKVVKLKFKDIIYEQPAEIAEYCAAVAWHWKPCLLYLEEVANIITSKQTSLPSSFQNIFKVLQLGRSQLSDIMVATQKATQLHEAFLDEATDIFIFAISKSEGIELEQKLKLEKNSLSFEIPDLTKKPLAELSKEELKDLYSFCRINQMRQVEWFYPLEFNTKIKTKKSEFKNEE